MRSMGADHVIDYTHKPNVGLETMNVFLEEGKVVPVIDKSYPLSEVTEALRYFSEVGAKGKIVITVEQNNKI